jgi:hypothetical protein
MTFIFESNLISKAYRGFTKINSTEPHLISTTTIKTSLNFQFKLASSFYSPFILTDLQQCRNWRLFWIWIWIFETNTVAGTLSVDLNFTSEFFFENFIAGNQLADCVNDVTGKAVEEVIEAISVGQGAAKKISQFSVDQHRQGVATVEDCGFRQDFHAEVLDLVSSFHADAVEAVDDVVLVGEDAMNTADAGGETMSVTVRSFNCYATTSLTFHLFVTYRIF